jgi:hypothetical protein
VERCPRSDAWFSKRTCADLRYAIAAKVYERGRKGSYELVAADF